MTKNYTLKWKPEEFKQKVKSQLAENGQEVGSFVQGNARQRLNNISDPEWGKQYRSLVASLIGFNVQELKNEVVVTVGVRPTYTKFHGYWIELGTSRRPSQPFLRPAIFDNKAKIARLFTK